MPTNKKFLILLVSFPLLIGPLANLVQAGDSHPLVSSNQALVCQNSSGTRYVVPDQLYSQILNLANVPPIIVSDAIKKGISFRKMVEDENFPNDNSISGAAKSLEKIRNQKNTIVLNLAGIYGSTAVPENRLKTQGYVIDDQANTPIEYLFPLIFGRETPVAVKCVVPEAESSTATDINGFINKHLKNFRV